MLNNYRDHCFLVWLALLAAVAIIAAMMVSMWGCGSLELVKAREHQEAVQAVDAFKVTRAQGIATIQEMAAWLEASDKADAALKEIAARIRKLADALLAAEPAAYPVSTEALKVTALAEKITADAPAATKAARKLSQPPTQKKGSPIMATVKLVTLGLMLIVTVAAYLYLRLTKGKGLAMLAGGAGLACCLTYTMLVYTTQVIIGGIVFLALAVVAGAYYLIQAGKVQVGIVKGVQARRETEAQNKTLHICDAVAREAMPIDVQTAVKDIKAAQGIQSVTKGNA